MAVHWGGRAALKDYAEYVCSLDLRSLAIMRISLAALMLTDLWVRSDFIMDFYTDKGALPRQAVIDHLNREYQLSLHMGTGSEAIIRLLFMVQAVAALLFLVGWRTRLANAVCWFLLISLHSRNGVVLQAGDIVFRCLMFWCLFLPLGGRLSVDSMLAREAEEPPERVVGLAALGLQVQLACIYLFTVALKWPGRDWHNGLAVYYASQIDHFAKQPQAQWMASQLWLSKFLTSFTLVWEFGGPLLLLMPVLRGPMRTLVFFGFLGLHVGFSSILTIGLFSFMCMAGWSSVLPGWFWDRIGWKITAGPRRPLSLINHGAAAFFSVLVIWWNFTTVKDFRAPAVPASIRWVGHLTRLDQKWDMFAPNPLKDDGWWVVPGQLVNGSEVDLFRGGQPVDWSKPALIAELYPDQRWRKYMRNLWSKDYKNLRVYYAKYLCRTWNNNHTGSQKLKTLQMIFMKEVTPKPGQPNPTPEEVEVWDHDCFKKD